MLQDNESRVSGGDIAQNVLPILQYLADRGQAAVNVEVYKSPIVSQIPVLMRPEKMYSPSVSKVAVGLMRVHMTGVRPMAREIARTRSLSKHGWSAAKKHRARENTLTQCHQREAASY